MKPPFVRFVRLVLVLLVCAAALQAVQASVQSDFLALVNAERASKGIAPLTMNAKLQAAATAHSQDMIDKDYFSHTSYNGMSFSTRIKNAGYTYKAAGENIAWHSGNPDAQKVFTMWKNSPGHYTNMMNAAYKEMGLGVVTGQYRTYMATMYTLDLATPYTLISQPAPAPTYPTPQPAPTPTAPSPAPSPVIVQPAPIILQPAPVQPSITASIDILTPNKAAMIGTSVPVQVKASAPGTIIISDNGRILHICSSCSTVSKTFSMAIGTHSLKAGFKSKEGKYVEDKFSFVLSRT
jgi:hypothetical protein